MELPTVEALHAHALERMKAMAVGNGPAGFAALIEGARYLAVAELCSAILKDIRRINCARQPEPSTDINSERNAGKSGNGH